METDKRKIVLEVGNHFIQGENTLSKREDGGLCTLQILVPLEQEQGDLRGTVAFLEEVK